VEIIHRNGSLIVPVILTRRKMRVLIFFPEYFGLKYKRNRGFIAIQGPSTGDHKELPWLAVKSETSEMYSQSITGVWTSDNKKVTPQVVNRNRDSGLI
jgi:hypothetical protein